MAQATLRARFGGLLLLVAIQCLVFCGCNTGSRNPAIVADDDPDFGDPFLADVMPGDGCAGDIISLLGFNFSPIISENVVTFTSSDGAVAMQGTVLTYIDDGPDPNFGTAATLQVMVPTGVRTGNVSLVAPSTGGDPISAGAVGFTGCPVIVGVALGPDGDAGFFAAIGGVIAPGEAVFYGYNLETVTSAQVTDSLGIVAQADVTAGLPMTVNYMLPPGVEAAAVEFPSGLTLDCGGGIGASDAFTFELFAAGGTGNPIAANVVEIQVTASVDQGVPGAITGVLCPTGLRKGDIPIHFNLLEVPAADRWDVIPQYFDVAVGDYVDCTPRIPGGFGTATIFDGTNMLPALAIQSSRIPALVGPGHSYTFIWDSAADLPNMTANTDLRLEPDNPNPGTSIFCSTTEWFTNVIAIDNSSPDTGSIFEDFAFNQFEDPTGTTAFWGPNLLLGNPVATPDTPTGSGTVDVVLDPFGIYILDTDLGEIVDETNPGIPVLILSSANNPGAALGEFHVRTMTIDENAMVSVIGSKPLVIRASGTGVVDEVVVSLNGIIDLNGANGIDGTATEAGIGGAGGAGGAAGGDGGEVMVMAGLFVQSVIEPTSGGNFGGEAGRSISFLRRTGVTTAKAGAAGGGGHSDVGGTGTLQTGVPTFALPGAGGPVRGDVANTEVAGGSGGGGGGAIPYRPSASSPEVQVRNGAGGGGGGGGLELAAEGSIEINGSILADGGDGGNGASPSAGAGGGGSGGTISLRATGNIMLGAGALILARGGEGGGTGTQFLGGDGVDGRIRFEAGGALNLPGLVNFGSVMPPVGATGVSAGLAAEPIDGGTGADGLLSLIGFPAGTYFIDTNMNTIFDDQGMGFFSSMPGFVPGVFNLSGLEVPAGINLRASGDNPLIIKVLGEAIISGGIDVSGFDGGQADFTDLQNPLPGPGGSGGPGGGAGGDGGIDDGTTAEHGGDGAFPPGLPDDLIADPPFGGGGQGGPLPPNLTLPARGGETLSITCGAGDSCIPGSGGGGAYAVDGEDGSGGQGEDGAGGLDFGSDFFLHPITGAPLKIGGGGGGAGGGNSEIPGDPPAPMAEHSPGTGGGGGGGFLQISVEGPLFVAFTAVILSEGGDAFQAAARGGNGAAGAGGGILIQGSGLLIFETGPAGEAPTISVQGGAANLAPTNMTYAGNGLSNGGDGGSGRIRIESPIGINQEPPTNCGGNPSSGICPQPTVSAFITAGTILSRAVSLPYPVVADGTANFALPSSFGPAALTLSPVPQPDGTFLRLLFQGARESLLVPSTAGVFPASVEDPTFLNGSEFIRLQWYLYSSATTGNVPSVDQLEILIDFVPPGP